MIRDVKQLRVVLASDSHYISGKVTLKCDSLKFSHTHFVTGIFEISLSFKKIFEQVSITTASMSGSVLLTEEYDYKNH